MQIGSFLLLFYKSSLRFLQGHALANVWFPVDVSFRQSTFVFLCFPAQLFLGLVCETSSLTIVTWYVYPRWNLPRGVIVYFYKVHFQKIGLLGKYWGLRSILTVPFRFLIPETFPEEDPKLSENSCTSCWVFPAWYSQSVSALEFPGCWFLNACQAVFWRDYCTVLYLSDR